MPNSNGSYKDQEVINITLDDNGDGTGAKDAIGDYSITPKIFFRQPLVGEVYVISEFILHLVDNSNMPSGSWGGITALTNGVIIRVSDDNGVISDITNGDPPKDNADISHLMPNFRIVTFGASDNAIIASFTQESFGAQAIIDGSQNQRIEVLLNDNFTGLVEQHFIIHGYK